MGNSILEIPMSGKVIGLDLACPDCGGTGVTIDYTTGCCRNANEDGSCCNRPIPEPIQVQCPRCEATGYLRTE